MDNPFKESTFPLEGEAKNKHINFEIQLKQKTYTARLINVKKQICFEKIKFESGKCKKNRTKIMQISQKPQLLPIFYEICLRYLTILSTKI